MCTRVVFTHTNRVTRQAGGRLRRESTAPEGSPIMGLALLPALRANTWSPPITWAMGLRTGKAKMSSQRQGLRPLTLGLAQCKQGPGGLSQALPPGPST